MKKLWGDNTKNGEDKDKFTHPTVYLSFTVLRDKDPTELVERMSFEWSRMDGQKLTIKDPQSFSIETPISVYHLHSDGHMKTLTSELTTILTQARDIAIKETRVSPMMAMSL